jgi:hypothetical protein
VFACDGGWRQPLEDEVRSGKAEGLLLKQRPALAISALRSIRQFETGWSCPPQN